jgi:hypothetical protein
MDGIVEPLSRDSIWGRLSNATRHWVRDLQIHQEIDSTNSHLMRRADAGIDGVVCFAEMQTGGRASRSNVVDRQDAAQCVVGPKDEYRRSRTA